MNYTIFVDESGDFEHSPRWIVSGVLCKGDPENAEKAIKGALYNVLKKYKLSSCKDLHLTELRGKFGNGQAIIIAESAFNSLDKDAVREIVKLQITELSLRLFDRDDRIQIHDRAVNYIVSESHVENSGAREVRRVIQSLLEDNIAEQLLRNTLLLSKPLSVDYLRKEMIIKN